jgi:hypothetical protein
MIGVQQRSTDSRSRPMNKLAIIAMSLLLAACASEFPTACTAGNMARGTADCSQENFAGTGASIPTLSAVYPVAGPSINAPSGKSVTAGKIVR